MTVTNGTVATRGGRDPAVITGTLAIRPGQEMWSDKQKAALSALGIKDATSADLAVYMHYCQRTGLDPFSRQIYMICRRTKERWQDDQGRWQEAWVPKQTIQVGIDGFRVIRDRTAVRLGVEVEYEDTIWYDDDGREHAVWLSDAPPAACRVVVLKNGRRFPAVLRTKAYAATNKQGDLVSQWASQPDHMIEKCAEAFALRRAFPHDLGGIYIEEEMPAAPPQYQQAQRVTAAEITGNGTAPADPTLASAAGSATGSETTPPDAPAQTARQDRTGDGPSAQPAPKGQPAGKSAVENLDRTVAMLRLGPDKDVRALLEWLCGEPWTATRAQVHASQKWLDDHLEAAQDDADVASDGIWGQYNTANPAGAGEPAGASSPSSSG